MDRPISPHLSPGCRSSSITPWAKPINEIRQEVSKNNDNTRKSLASIQENICRLETTLQDLSQRAEKDLGLVNTRIGEIEERVSDMQAMVSSRFNSLEQSIANLDEKQGRHVVLDRSTEVNAAQEKRISELETKIDDVQSVLLAWSQQDYEYVSDKEGQLEGAAFEDDNEDIEEEGEYQTPCHGNRFFHDPNDTGNTDDANPGQVNRNVNNTAILSEGGRALAEESGETYVKTTSGSPVQMEPSSQDYAAPYYTQNRDSQSNHQVLHRMGPAMVTNFSSHQVSSHSQRRHSIQQQYTEASYVNGQTSDSNRNITGVTSPSNYTQIISRPEYTDEQTIELARHISMTEEHRTVLTRNCTKLMDTDLDLVTVFLIEDGVFTYHHVDVLNKTETDLKKTMEFFRILKKRGDVGFYSFRNALLNAGQIFLVNILDQNQVIERVQARMSLDFTNQTFSPGDEQRRQNAERQVAQNVVEGSLGTGLSQQVYQDTGLTIASCEHGSILCTFEFATVEELDKFWDMLKSKKPNALSEAFQHVVVTDEIKDMVNHKEMVIKLQTDMTLEDYLSLRRKLATGHTFHTKDDLFTSSTKVNRITFAQIASSVESDHMQLFPTRSMPEAKNHRLRQALTKSLKKIRELSTSRQLDLSHESEAEQRAHVTRLENATDILKAELARKEEIIQELQEARQTDQEDNRELQQRAVHQHNDSMDRLLKEKEELIVAKNRDIERLQEKFEETDQKLIAFEVANEDLENKLKIAKRANGDLENKLKNAEARSVGVVAHPISDIEAEYESKISGLENNIGDMESRNSDLERQLDNKQKELSELKTQYGKERQMVQDLQEKLKIAESRYEAQKMNKWAPDFLQDPMVQRNVSCYDGFHHVDMQNVKMPQSSEKGYVERGKPGEMPPPDPGEEEPSTEPSTSQGAVGGARPKTVKLTGSAARGMVGEEAKRGRGVDTVLCIDTSKSMKGDALTNVKKMIQTIINVVEEAANAYGLDENLSIVQFGAQTGVVVPLTSDFDMLRRSLEFLTTGGMSPMTEGFRAARKEIQKNSGQLVVAGRRVRPRIIMFTDGNLSDDRDYGEEDVRHPKPTAKYKFLTAIQSYSDDDDYARNRAHITFIGCGQRDKVFLGSCAKAIDAVYYDIEDKDAAKRIGGFYRNTVWVYRFAAPFKDPQSMVSLVADKKTFTNWFKGTKGEEILPDHMNDFEMEEMYKIFIQYAEDSKIRDDSDPSLSGDPELQMQLPLGTRVRRGPDWRWENQDMDGPGTVIGYGKDKMVLVEWDYNHQRANYRYGNRNAYDVLRTEEPRQLGPDEMIATGVKCMRGPDWEYGDQDGGPGSTGVVYRVHRNGKVDVRWLSNGFTNSYRFGDDGCFDLKVCGEGEEAEAFMAQMNKVEEGHIICWQYKEEISNNWNTFPERLTLTIEQAYQGNHKGGTDIEYNSKMHYIDFQTMKMNHTPTGEQFDVSRIVVSEDKFGDKGDPESGLVSPD